MAKGSPTSIRLEEELYKKVVEEATKEKRSISAQIEYIIEKYYEIKKSLNNDLI
jgi:hypothetical protein